MRDDNTFEIIQGTAATILGAGQITIYYLIAKILVGMYSAWSIIIWGVAGLLGLEALLMLGFGLIMLIAAGS